jgi:hypothetical protein
MRSYSQPTGAPAQKGLKKITDELKEHLSMIYQRFLDPSFTNVQNVRIKVNGEALKPWDPFCVKYSDCVAEEFKEIENSEAFFSIKAYVLPRKEEFEDPKIAAEAKIGNDLQGLYIYRENRLIHYADWLGMFSKEPHGSLLRVEFSFDHKLDDAFHIDIKKSQILLDNELYNWLKEQFLPAPRRAADNRYRQGQKKKAQEKSETAHLGSNNSIRLKVGEIDGAEVKPTDKADEAIVTNTKGVFKFKLKVTNSRKPGELFIQPTDSIDYNVLFEPALIDGEKGVRINTSHPYYHKVYVPNLKSDVTIQGMDSLLWALCNAELSTINANTLNHFEELRFELSRVLKRLVEDLPEPDFKDNETE